jgi:hypothetical protein
MRPLDEALERFLLLHGHGVDPTSQRDSMMLAPLLEATGAARLTKDEIEAGRVAEAETFAYRKLALDAMTALTDAWNPNHGGVLIDWIGCSSAEFLTAVEPDLEDRN